VELAQNLKYEMQNNALLVLGYLFEQFQSQKIIVLWDLRTQLPNSR
jgi:hypothetical protein